MPIATTSKHTDASNKSTCKRSHQTNSAICNVHHQLDANKLSIKCASAQQAHTSNCTNRNVCNLKSAPLHRNEDAKSSQMNKASLSCDSISKSTFIYANSSTTDELILIQCSGYMTETQTTELDRKHMDTLSASPNADAEFHDSSLLSVSGCGSSGSSCSNHISSASTITACNSPMISLSKSETNIFNCDSGANKLAIYNVVSLNDLNESDPFFQRPMNDLSKNQCLTNISDQELAASNKANVAQKTNLK